jgi:hypothetical protein
MPRLRRAAAGLVAAAALCSTLPAPASATPVKCSESDLSPDGRIFPEGNRSVAFLRFDEFKCGTELLAKNHPDKLEITTIGTSKAGHPLSDILMTDETVKGPKEKLLVVSSIHGNEVGAREGAVRALEDMVDDRFLGKEQWVKQVMREYVIHWVFPNPDGWIAGDIAGSEGAGISATRGNDSGRDLNRQFPVKGYIDTNNAPLAEPEGNAVLAKLFDDKPNGWFLGTDNHGQGPDTYAAAGLQIVGQFDFQKSETLARFADGITESMKAYGVLEDLETLKSVSGQDLGSYHWGTLYDMLGYSASGSMIDYYNTFDGNAGTGFATELTAGTEVNWLTYPGALVQVWIDSVRAINYTMFRQAIDRKKFTYGVGGEAAYVFDPEVIRHDDADGAGAGAGGDIPQRPYAVSRMRFFSDLNKYADRPLDKIRVGDDLRFYDSVVLANDAMPEPGDEAKWFQELKAWVEAGGNLIVTDAAAPALAKLGLVEAAAITSEKHYVGFAQFTDRSHPLNANLRGVASQTYDTVPIGYAFGSEDTAPNWKVAQAAWEAKGGTTQGTNGTGKTIYGEMPVGKGRVRFLGALLPDPTEDYYHPYGLQNYAVTYTGYTLLQNMLSHDNPSAIASAKGTPPKPGEPASCRRRGNFTVRLRLPRGAKGKTVRARVNGKRVSVRRKGRTVTIRVPARSITTSRAVLRVDGKRSGKKKSFTVRRAYKLCR